MRSEGIKRTKNTSRVTDAEEDLDNDTNDSSSEESFEGSNYIPKRKQTRNQEFYRKRSAYQATKKRAHAAGIKPEVPTLILLESTQKLMSQDSRRAGR